MERETIERAVRLGGLALPDDLEFEVAGAEPVLPSPHYLASATAAARILTGAGANELWRLRTGRTQALSVDLRHAAAALRSYELVGYVDGEERAPVQGELPGPRFTSIMARATGATCRCTTRSRTRGRSSTSWGWTPRSPRKRCRPPSRSATRSSSRTRSCAVASAVRSCARGRSGPRTRRDARSRRGR